MDVQSRGPTIIAVFWSFVAVSLVFVGLRIYCKFLRRRGLWWDDYILILSWVLAFTCAVLSIHTVHLGYGKHTVDIPPENLATISIRGLVMGILLILATGWSKTSFAVTLIRLVQGWQRTALWIIIVTMNFFLGISAITNVCQCNPIEKPGSDSTGFGFGHCLPANVNIFVTIFAGAYSAAMDLVLASMPWVLLWDLRMSKREKLGVAVAMSMGVFAAATGIIKCIKIESLGSLDFFYDGSALCIWSIAEIGTTIMASCIPVLRALVREISPSAGRYWLPFYKGMRWSRDTLIGLNTVSAETIVEPEPGVQSDDGASDKGILSRMGGAEIMQTSEVLVTLEDGNHGESGYGLDEMGPRPHTLVSSG
ncbi:hypothetical protein BJ170DRAFT_263628 [Xylariales sp. AK1849]|nr:hypothetical protein BJ170DRAFT_263628 [Xylariales sp. AK1849]